MEAMREMNICYDEDMIIRSPVKGFFWIIVCRARVCQLNPVEREPYIHV